MQLAEVQDWEGWGDPCRRPTTCPPRAPREVPATRLSGSPAPESGGRLINRTSAARVAGAVPFITGVVTVLSVP
ncbi:hypothetical protein GCM10010178_91240 [Lentzea flava]|uniref:Uncharacterized protein n=1 Tax=Lentzea flava TaxID=103732 RepID=A0ABQ2VHE4_9PSEU|nr:hypothetical protein GCM10010178_91240 [Lentzea flava]